MAKEVKFGGSFEINKEFMTGWQRLFLEEVMDQGGFVNFHAHLDRAETLEEEYLKHVSMNPMDVAGYPLKLKQSLTGDLHKGLAYKEDNLRERLSRVLDMSIHYGTREIWSFIDTTADEARGSLDVALEVKESYKGKIDLRLAAYPIFGFKDSDEDRWNVFREAAEKADFLGALPERDVRQDHVGYNTHLRRILELGKELNKPVQVHVDQMNHPTENGTETLVEAVKWLWPKNYKSGKDPMVWAVHAISPSGYSEDRFEKLLDDLKEYNVGVVSCPGAAMGMRQLRPVQTPTHNSIARVREMVVKGIPVKFGTDNIGDFLMPSGHPDMFLQMWRASDDLRMYSQTVLAKLARGSELNDVDRDSIRRLLEEDKNAFKTLSDSYEER
ncbi:MAG: hypothetical protein IIA85_00480 [Nanoarchaeota archaeon]|nr:hypothetical protein [Nanoarchaeota archaeon]